MKYYFVSDLHGYDPIWLKIYLKLHNFNADTDTLVIVGDVVDRGFYTIPLMKYIDSFPHVIKLWGNHDVRTREIICRVGHAPDMYDKHNGVAATLHSICGLNPDDKLENIWYYLHVLMVDLPVAKENCKTFLNYCHNCVWALEFSNLIVTHGWLPYTRFIDKEGKIRTELFPIENRPVSDWVDATWANTIECVTNNLFPQKDILVGHWWAGDIRARFEQHKLLDVAMKDGTVDFRTFKYKNATFIDSCIFISDFINVEVYESDEEPFVYVTGDNNIVIKKPLFEFQQ